MAVTEKEISEWKTRRERFIRYRKYGRYYPLINNDSDESFEEEAYVLDEMKKYSRSFIIDEIDKDKRRNRREYLLFLPRVIFIVIGLLLALWFFGGIASNILMSGQP